MTTKGMTQKAKNEIVAAVKESETNIVDKLDEVKDELKGLREGQGHHERDPWDHRGRARPGASPVTWPRPDTPQVGKPQGGTPWTMRNSLRR